MKNSKLALLGLRNGAGALAYIALVALFFHNVERIFKNNPKDTVLAPIFLLTLFVLSALIEASLVLGQPIITYLNGQKVDAFKLLGFTAGTMAAALVVILLTLAL